MKKRTINIILAFMLALAMLAACGVPATAPAEPSTPDAPATDNTGAVTDDGEDEPVFTEGVTHWQAEEGIVISFLNRWAQGVDAMYEPMTAAIANFEAEYPNVSVDFVAIGGADDVQFYERMRTAAAIGDMFDIFQNYGGSTIRSYVEAGILLDLTPIFDTDPEWRSSFMDVFSMVEFDGIEGTFGVPLTYFATVLYCNTLLFDEYGLEIPTTLREFEEVCDAFVAAGVTPIPRSGEGWRWGHWSTGFIMQFYGADFIFDLANRDASPTGPEMMRIADMFLDWQSRGFFGDNIASLDSTTESVMFAMGQSPMIAIGTWLPESVINNNPDLLPHIEVVWFPYDEDRPDLRYGNMGGPNENLSVSISDNPHVTAATVALLKHMTAADTITEAWVTAPYTPFAITTATPPSTMNPLTIRSIELITSVNPSLMQEWNMYDPIGGMQDIVRNAYAGMMADGSSQEAMERIQAEIDLHE